MKVKHHPLTIREVTEEDLPVLLPLYAHLGMDDGQVLSLDEARRIFRKMGQYPDYRLYAAFVRERPIGVFALLIMDNLGHQGRPSAVLEDLVVHPDWRAQGIGRWLVAFAWEKSLEKRCYKLTLSSNRQRTRAHRFYEHLGFQQHGISFAVWMDPEKK